jgi:hypothetical protein
MDAYKKFTHKTPHLKGKQHQLDPNLDLKQLVHHATVQYVDRDADGDVDVYDNPKKKIPDENVSSAQKAQEYSNKLIAKQKGEIKHTKRGMAYEDAVNEEPRIARKPGQPTNSKKHSDLYTDENPKGTIGGLGFKDVATAKQSVSKIKDSGKTHAHKIQAAIAMEQRAKVMGKSSEAAVFRSFINSMKEKTSEEVETSLVEKILGEENCGKGMYWCNTNKECKPLPKGFDVPGQKIKPTEVGIGKPVEGSCSKTKKGKDCPVHGKMDCSMKESKDHEYSMARSELSIISNALKRLQKKMSKGEGNVEAWVQSKITKAADYLDSAADYIDSGEMDEAANPAQQAAIAINMKKKGIKPKSEVDEACWVGYKQEGLKKKGKKMVPNCVPEETEIQEASKSGDASLHDWFAKSKSSDGKPGWVQLGGKYAGKPCAKQPGQTTKPKCGSSKMAAEMSPEEEERAAERKRREDPNPDRKGKAINVATEEYVEEDACKTKVKSRYKVWPSAYASGALVKCRKVGAANWGNSSKNEEIVYEGDYWHPDPEIDRKLGGPGPNQRAREDHPQPKSDPKKLRKGESYMDWNKRQRGLKNSYEPDGELIDESTRLQAETGNILAVILNWRGKTYSIRMFFPQIGMPSRKDVTTEIQKIYPGSQVLQYKISTIEPGMPLIQVVNSKSKNYLLNSKTIGEEVEIEEDWQKENRKDKTDGLSQKAVNAYRRENPGSNLQTAVTEKKPTGKRASRRKNFCSRMSGMKSKLTSAKTARDPDSRINKALRRWNCN